MEVRRAEVVTYHFLDCELDHRRFRLCRRGIAIDLEPRVFDVLIYLVEQRDRLVSRRELIDSIWQGQAVGSSVITRAICLARKAVRCPRAIRTVHTRGYQWVLPVEAVPGYEVEVTGSRQRSYRQPFGESKSL